MKHSIDLNRIVDTYIPIRSNKKGINYIKQLNKQVVPLVDKLTKQNKITWFAFLVHSWENLSGREKKSDKLYIHLRFHINNTQNIKKFIKQLPKYCKKPMHNILGEMSGIDSSLLRNKDIEEAWYIHGLGSSYILSLIKSHEIYSTQQSIQFLHYLTNTLLIGGHCIYLPVNFIVF